jgi:hypothetical protein
MDSTLSVFIFLALLFWLTPKLKYHFLLSGIFFGLAYWTKTPAIFLIPFPLVSALISSRKLKNSIKAILSIFVSLAIIFIMKTSVFYHRLFARSQDFAFSLNDVLYGQTDQIFGNLKNFFSWFISYNYYPYLILFIASLYLAIKNKQKTILNLSLAAIIFISPFIILGKVVTPRYYLPAIFLIIFIASYSFNLIKNIKLKILLLIILIIYPLYQNFNLLNNYFNFNFPKPDEYQYLKEWSSGIGISQSMNYFVSQAKDQKIKVLTEGFFGATPDGLFIYYANLPQNIKNNLTIVGVGGLSTTETQKELEKGQYNQIFYLGNSHRIDPIEIDNYQLTLINSYPKKDNYSSLQIFKYPYQYEI